jgi:hypothetical protein
MRKFLRTLRAAPSPSVSEFARKAQAGISDESLRGLAHRLGVSVASLRRLHVGEVSPSLASEFNIGWALGAFAFPMRDADGIIVGNRLRLRSGDKRAVPGGHEGLFVPDGIKSGGTLFVAEGPTDTSALLDLGYACIGRPSCTGARSETIAFVTRLVPRSVVVVSDADRAGRDGAATLARSLVAHCADLRIICPPTGCKDARDWVRAGATAADVEARIAQAKQWSMRVVVGRGA